MQARARRTSECATRPLESRAPLRRHAGDVFAAIERKSMISTNGRLRAAPRIRSRPGNSQRRSGAVSIRARTEDRALQIYFPIVDLPVNVFVILAMGSRSDSSPACSDRRFPTRCPDLRHLAGGRRGERHRPHRRLLDVRRDQLLATPAIDLAPASCPGRRVSSVPPSACGCSPCCARSAARHPIGCPTSLLGSSAR